MKVINQVRHRISRYSSMATFTLYLMSGSRILRMKWAAQLLSTSSIKDLKFKKKSFAFTEDKIS